MAEIMFDGNRSKGEGVVQFAETAEGQTAGEKFTGYMYGGRPLSAFPRHLAHCRKWVDGLTNLYRCPI